MSLNSTPSSERTHIGIFGRRNAGKSSLINALTGQNLAIVSDVRGTTTDPVFKAMELLPLGPVVMIDTPGLDDTGELGKLRIQKAYQVLNKTDIAVLVVDGTTGITPQDNAILTRIQDKKIPLLLVLNKADLVSEHVHQEMIVSTHLKYKIPLENILWTNTTEHLHIHELKERLGSLVPSEDSSRFIVRDLVKPGDFVVLVVPIDSAAPKGRLILPQQQTIRDLLDAGTTAIVVKETELKSTLDSLGKKPALVMTACKPKGIVQVIHGFGIIQSAVKTASGFYYNVGFIFYPFCKIQGESGNRCQRRTCIRHTGRRRYHSDQRRLHPPSSV